MISDYKHYEGLNLTLNVTEDCNLRCKYCYETNKKPKTLSIDIAKKFIDLILSEEDPIGVLGTDQEWILEEGLILDFLGGDALMKPELVRDILHYFIWKSNVTNNKWAFRWRATICTNGTLLKNKEVINLLEEFCGAISLSISVDGCPEIHDMNRVFTNGSGTSNEILNQWDWYLDYCNRSNQLPNTKSTLSKNSIPYIYDSLKYLHETLKLNYIFMNFVMEDTGLTKEDLELFDKQLEKCCDYVLEHKDDLHWSVFSELNIGEPFTEENKHTTKCGSGMMPTLSTDGNLYPCFRWLPHSMKEEHKNDFVVGNVFEGIINKDKLKQIREADRWAISDEECKSCSVQSACSYCIAGCYDEFNEFKRTKHICEITKIQSKWAKKYWEVYNEIINKE